ncbi:MAG: M1 family metallopeptidase [Balneolaceae bacterium]
MSHIPLTFLLFFFLFQSLSAQDPVYESGGELIREQAAFNVKHYDLDLKVDPADSTVAGTGSMTAEIVHPAKEIVLDLDPRFQIDSVQEISRAGAKNLTFRTTPGSKRIYIHFDRTRQPGEKITVRITYHGRPVVAANPPWDGGFVWETSPSGDPWIGVACQTAGAWIWWPNKDHPSDKPDSVSLSFTLPDELTGVSNGRFLGTSQAEEGWKTWHWFVSAPISNYNVTLNAARYETISDRYRRAGGEAMDIVFWVLPEYREKAEKLFPQFEEQIRYLEDLLGPYPFRSDKYGVAHAPYLGMEHQTLIAYGANFKNDNLFGSQSGFDDLHQHELAHEWWGNLVTAWDWRDFWIHEGFATYMQALYAEHLGGSESYRRMMAVFRQSITSRRQVAPRESRTTAQMNESGRGGDIYFKGAWFLHTLRYLVGDKIFFESLRRFAYPDDTPDSNRDGGQVRFVTTDDYLELVNRLSGEKLEWVFEVYLRRKAMPVLTKKRTADTLILAWNAPGGAHFPMPVEIVVDGERKVLEFEEGPVSVDVRAGAPVEIDPDRRILMSVEEE